MRTAARRPVRGAAEGSKAKALPLDQVLQHIQRADGLDRAVVAALISHLHASDLARSISLYTSTNTKESEAGLAWAARDDNRYPIEAGIVRVAKQAANAVLTTLQSLLDAPQGALRDELALFILLDCFRVAMATLTKAQGSVEQLGAVGLSVARKLIALAKYSEALTELVAVAACVAGSDVGSGTVRTPPPPVVRMHTIFAVPMGGPGEAHVRSVLDIQALAVHAALAQAGERDIDAIHTIYRLEHGPGAWQAHARNIGLDSAADRAAYAMERAIFQHLSRCKASGPAAYMLRMDTLRHLAPVAQLDVDAYWDRVERVCASYARRGSFDEIHAQLVSLVDTAPEIRHGGPFGHLCEWWTTHARQAGHSGALTVIAAFQSGETQSDVQVNSPSTPTRHAESEQNGETNPPSSAFSSLHLSSMSASSVLSHLDGAKDALEDPSTVAMPSIQSVIGALQCVSSSHLAERAELAPALGTTLAAALRYAQAPGALGAAELLDACLGAVERTLEKALLADAMHAARILCGLQFADGVPSTYNACATYLQRAAGLAGHGGPSKQHYVSEVAFHYGSRLYASGQHGHAVPFLRIACDTEGLDDEGTRAKYVRKCQVLAGAYQHISDYHNAYDTYCRGLAQDHALDGAAEAAGHALLPAALETEPLALSAAMVKGVLQLSVYCLLYPQDLSHEKSLAHQLKRLDLSPASRGAWLEYAAHSMESMLLRDETPKALQDVLHAAIPCYSPTEYPLRRARVLLKLHLYDTLRDTPNDDKAIAACLDRPLVKDAGLEAWHEELRCTMYLQNVIATVCLHASNGPKLEEAAKLLQEACARLIKSTQRPSEERDKEPIARTRSGRSRGPTPVSTRVTRSRAATPSEKSRPSTPARSASTLSSSTPPRKGSGEGAAPNTTPIFPVAKLLSAACDAMAYVGMDYAYFDALRALQRLTKQKLPAMHAEATARIVVHLVSLRAGADACSTAKSCEKETAPMLFADMMGKVQAGETSDIVAQYERGVQLAQSSLPGATSSWERVSSKCTEYDLQAQAALAYASYCAPQGQYTEALSATLQALRTYLRSAMVLAKAAAPDPDVFATKEAPGKRSIPRYAMLELRALHWRVAKSLSCTYLALSRMYAERGAVRDANAFAQEAIDFSEQHRAPLLRAAALLWRAELYGSQRDMDAARVAWANGMGLLGTIPSAQAVHAKVLAAEWSGEYGNAWAEAGEAWSALQQLFGADLLRDLYVRIACATLDDDELRDTVAHELASVTLAERSLAYAESEMRADAVWAILPEAARALPGAAPRPTTRGQASLAKNVKAWLDDAEDLLAPLHINDARLARRALRAQCSLSLLRAPFCASEGAAKMATEAAVSLNASVSVSVRRAYVDTAARRQQPAKVDWFAIRPPPRPVSPFSQSVAGVYDAPLQPPSNSAVLTLALSSDRCELLLSRLGGHAPTVYTLPIDRQSRREGEEEPLTADAVLTELRAILAASNAGVQGAKDVHALEARKAWWTERRALDERLRELLQSIQDTWLGAFQGLFVPWPDVPLSGLRDQVVRAFDHALSGRMAHKHRVLLPDTALACLAALPTDCTAEVLEDWAHFVMDATQLAGVSIAQDEVDLDELCSDLRSALDEHQAKRRKDPERDEHLYLVLDRELCEIPWESMPILRERSVSRVPSWEFLAALTPAVRTLDRQSTAYLLNPGGDLVRSEARFAGLLQAQPRWQGTIGRTPVIDEVARALATKDTFLYFGHAGGEMYVQPMQLRSLGQCATSMLWGCSSGVLRDHGEYDPSGTPYDYLVAQCPAMLANLWDTTDKELDGVCETVLRGVGLFSPAAAPLSRAVAAARSACKLPYLTGAACVVYGVPVQWQ